jgi:hypothetical protein
MTFRMLPNFVIVSAEGVVADEELPADVRAAMGLLMAINRCGGRYMVANANLHYSGPARFKQSLRAQRAMIITLLS